MMKKVKGIGFILSILAVFLLAACRGSDDDSTEENGETNYSEAVDHTIIGIEPGAGISVATENALEEYDNLDGWDVELSSTGAMMSELGTAIDNEEPIVITGWNPHWMFALYPDMKYLEDPQEVYGGEETLNSLARLGLEDDNPDAYQFIDQFEWEVEDMEEIMYEAEESGENIEDVAVQWVEDNQDRVDAWAEGVNDGNGAEIELASTPWDSERASSNVMKAAMEQHGFEVTVTEVDVAVVFESVASGDVDATLAAWLPLTHSEFYEANQDDFEDLGPNLEGAKIGLVVPEYMDIDSIEDLEAD
ncbi:glycine betaine ABC transporter substrate-binding protein [Oceanobacillus jeddahense]|uniref:Glycine/betaine ABC transporter n=1 Tax=Oceanobacillus jeddahense TaxID=1462527 RepID=A0ABY5JW09_9BACI|nr:glycine betaine ABC transporter substrate-binding protein [Oceanobacillus jeddahense]UUI04521.1 glycine/betaine ABC transporter [Oceanobacillus jeddahense]